MSIEETRPLSPHRPQRPTESFSEFSIAERERWQNTGEEFDLALFDEAVDLVIRKLRKFEDEGLA
jgi:hypothetical protein